MRKLSPLPPGVAVAMAAIPALMVPLYWEHLCPLGRGAGIAAIFLLVSIEIRSIYRDRNERDRQVAASMQRLEQVIASSQELLKASRLHAQSLQRIHRVVNDPHGSLIVRAIRLSEALISWVYTRLENWPRSQPTQTYQVVVAYTTDIQDVFAAQQASAAYAQETMHFYLNRFAPEVEAVRLAMAERGIVDETLDHACTLDHSGVDTLLFIGQRIGELAEQITD